ncbi:hypothetical protein RN001_003951 [Aquatica leii]|uniref:Uncharacterized protein n=1 Tax=Aquatica leii TaxID=1421715 RepID=A0AAN7PGB9_9COLE|nr:hypothetical protein RN001_003951 [Aquatica leii]
MKITSLEFVSHFHSLKGTTVGEKQKNLYNLLKESDLSDFDFSHLVPKTILEEKLKLEVLIYFRRVPEILEILKSENPDSVERVFKIGRWFFETAFDNITGKDLVAEIFPFVSFNVKVKLLNKLSAILTNTRLADEIYKAVGDVYGLHLASKILPACSYDLIIENLDTHKLKLPPKHLCLIIKKFPQNREELLETLERFNIERECNNILVFLKNSDVSSYLKLHKKHELKNKMGWRTTDRFISDNKEAVVQDPNVYYKMLHNKQIAKSLSGDFGRFFKNLFPDDIEEFSNARKSIVSKLNLLPRQVNALDLYLTTFRLVYGSEIWDHPELVTVKLLKMLDPEERGKRIKDEYRSSVNEDEWKCLYNIQTSMPFLKKRISLTSDIRSRAQLIGLLVDTCKINEDKTALIHVCKYMLSKHRNDHISVRLAFFRHLRENFVLEKLEEEHWVPINELIQIFQMNQESFYEAGEFLEGYIHYRLIKNLPVKEELTQWITNKETNLNLIRSVPKYEKMCLQGFGEIIPGEDLLLIDYLIAIYDYNCRNKTDEIPLFAYPKAIEVLKQNVSECGWKGRVYDLLVFFLNHVSAEEKPVYLNLLMCLTRRQRFCKCTVYDNLLKNDPVLILRNIEDVMHFVLKMVNEDKKVFLKRLKYYHHLNVPQSAVECCTKYEKYLTDCDAYDKNEIEESAFIGMSILMTKEDFLAYAFNFCPEEPRACADKNKFKRQKWVCRNVKNIHPASDVLAPVLNFCKGDYLKLTLGSLYSICGNVNEDKLIPALNDLSNRAVSVQKHCLHLSFRYMNRQCIYNAINKFMDVKTKPSVRKFILKVLVNFFSKNPSDYTWDLVKRSVNFLDESDAEAFALFLQVNKIPKEYLPRYQVFAWDVLFKLPNPGGVLNTKLASVLNSIDNEGSQRLPVDFCQNIVNSHLFHADELDVLHTSVQAFACKYIIYCKDAEQKAARLQSVFAIMKYYINNRWSHRQYRNTTRSYCSNFLQTFCSEFINNRSNDRELLQNLFEMWNNLVQPHEDFQDYLYLKFTLMYLERYSSQQFAKEFLQVCNRLTEIYGLVIIELLCKVFSGFVVTCLKREGEEHACSRYRFIEDLVKVSDSDAGALAAILLMHGDDSYDYKIEDKRNEIIQTLEDKKNVVVDLFLCRQIRGTTTLDYY